MIFQTNNQSMRSLVGHILWIILIVNYLQEIESFLIPVNNLKVIRENDSFLYLGVSLDLYYTEEPDFIETAVGGTRYEMVPLPDSMLDTTLFVGNLCEFVKDGDLSNLFKTVSTLHSLPACVARKVNTDSLGYGFVAFPNAEEKEAALEKFQNYELNGRPLRVECIVDHPKRRRVRVPGKLVAYTCGEIKKTGDGRVNTLRRVARDEEFDSQKKKSAGKKKKKKSKIESRKVDIAMRLNDKEQEELERTIRKGYLSLRSTAYRRGRKSSALANFHREWCDKRGKPQIILCKASGGRPLDNIIVDMSPLRMQGMLDDGKKAEDFLKSWKSKISEAALETGMELRDDYVEDNCISILDEDVCIVETDNTMIFDERIWSSERIQNLPTISMGVFEGERSKAKKMAKILAQLWEIPEKPTKNESSRNNSRKSKRKGLSEHRRRNRNLSSQFS